MSLTQQETPLVIQWLKEYPVGIPSEQWGIGPFSDALPFLIDKPIDDAKFSECMEYG